MKITTKRNAIVTFMVSAIALIIGTILVPMISVLAGAIITLSILTLVYSLYCLYKIISAEEAEKDDEDEEDENEDEDEDEERTMTVSEKKNNWRDIVRILTLAGVIIIIILLVKGCGKQKIKEQIVEKQTVINQEVTNSKITNANMGNVDMTNVDMENAEITDAEIDNANMTNVEMEDASINHAAITDADISNADMGNVIMDKADIEKAEVEKVTIKESVDTPCDTEVTKPVETPKTETSKVEKTPTHTCAVAKTIKTDPTCTTAGSVKEVCSCGKTLSETAVKATGHSWDNGKVTKAATEKATGIKTYTCKNCGENKTEKIAKLEHECEVCDVVEKEATCTKAGYIRKVCSCGEILSEKTVKALGHDYEVVSEKEATSTVDGYVKYRCANCGDTYKDVIPATGEVEEPVEDEFVITVSKTEVVGNSFSAVEVYTSGSASALKYYQGGNVFNVTVKDAHHLTLTVGDEDTFGSIIIYDDAHQDKAIEVIRRSPVDPLA